MAKAKSSRSGRTIPPLVVQHIPSACAPQKVYSVQVSWRSCAKSRNCLPALAGPYTVRLIMAGGSGGSQRTAIGRRCKPTTKAIFYVTPLVRRGWLKGERLEILYDGEKLQEVALPAKVTTQCKTWIFLLLAFLVPWFLVNYVQLTEMPQYLAATKGSGGPWGHLQKDLNESIPYLNTPEVQGPLKQGVEAIGLEQDSIGKAYSWVFRLFTRDEMFLEGTTSTVKLDLAFWSAVAFLVLAFLSLIVHRQKWKRKVSKPIPVPEEE